VTKIQEETAAIEAHRNIDIFRNKSAAEDLHNRPNHCNEEYYQATKMALERLFEPTLPKNCHTHTLSLAKLLVQPSARVNELAGTVALMKTDAAYQELKEPYDDNNTYKPYGHTTTAEGRPGLADKLHNQQRRTWTTVNTYFTQLQKFKDGRGARPQPFRLIVHGGPGTSKSF
jgi:hypothetical protein